MAKSSKTTEDTEEPGKPKGKGGAIKLALGALVLLGVGAGGAYGAFAAGLIGGAGEREPDMPKLVRKGDTDPYALPGKDKDEGTAVYGEGGSEYRTAYYSFSESFTSNLANSPSLIQVELAVSTQRDGRVLGWVKTHELAVRSAILGELAATPEADVYDVEGREQLGQRLTKAINAVLEENEGFGGIEAVHFKGFLVQ